MNFIALKQSNESFLAGFQTRIENKQRMNLSEHAMAILLNDIEVFQPNTSDSDSKEIISSAAINRIIQHFRGEARSSIAQAVQNERIRLQSILKDIESTQTRSPALEAVLHDFESRLIEEMKKRCRQKGCEIYFRIRKENLAYLVSEEGQAEGPAYNDKIGLYFKAILEEYCEQAYAKRERIYFKDHLDEIQLAIDYKKLLKVTLKTKNLRTGSAKNNIMYVKPHSVKQDSERLYNYLVGMMSSCREGPWQIGSIRLTSILKCDHQMHPMTLTSDTRAEIDEEIKRKGVQFLSDNQSAQRIVVRFTPKGERLYRSMLHLRPQYLKKTDDRIYEFHCSIHQAHNYFFKFGEDAIVLEPKSLASSFADKYQRAVRSYLEL